MATLPESTFLKHHAHHRLKPPRLVNFQQTIDLLNSIKIPSRLDAGSISQLRATIKKAAKRLRYLERMNGRFRARLRVTSWRIDNGARLAETRDLNAQLAWLLNGQCRYATAQGKRTFLKLGVEHYQRIGKLGAQVRWQRERERKALQILEDYHV